MTTKKDNKSGTKMAPLTVAKGIAVDATVEVAMSPLEHVTEAMAAIQASGELSPQMKIVVNKLHTVKRLLAVPHSTPE